MFGLNKGARTFIQKNFITVRNCFTNEGLIDFYFDASLHSNNDRFNNYEQLEELYFKALNRNEDHRKLTIKFHQRN